VKRNLNDYLGVSRRDVGAGIVAGVAALLGIFLFNSLILDESIRFQVISKSMFVYVSDFPVPLIAVCVSTVVWRVMLPEGTGTGPRCPGRHRFGVWDTRCIRGSTGRCELFRGAFRWRSQRRSL
jgi:hypothetical protein